MIKGIQVGVMLHYPGGSMRSQVPVRGRQEGQGQRSPEGGAEVGGYALKSGRAKPWGAGRPEAGKGRGGPPGAPAGASL